MCFKYIQCEIIEIHQLNFSLDIIPSHDHTTDLSIS